MILMKTLLQQILLVFLLCFIRPVCGEEVQCRDMGGTVPISIYNSPYTLLPNGSICCPMYVGNTCEQDEKQLDTNKCLGGLVSEPCHFCKTCAKLAGESCGGHQNLYGTCDEGLECVYSDQNSTHGICYGTADKGVGEVCGGRYGTKGRCLPGLDIRCNVSESAFLDGEDVQGVCLNSSTAPGACFKTCVSREHTETCGNDGRWYINKCELRKQNCIIPEGRQPEKIKPAGKSVCEHACREVDLSDYPNSTVSSYSYGLVNGSEATVVCVKGYELTRGKEKVTLRCFNRQWHNVLTNDDGSEKLKPNWSVLCYKSHYELSLDTSNDS